MASTVGPAPGIPASVRQSDVTELAAIAPPAAHLAGVAVVQSSGGVPASEIPTPDAAAAPPRNAGDVVVDKGEVGDNMGLQAPKCEEAGEEAVSPL